MIEIGEPSAFISHPEPALKRKGGFWTWLLKRIKALMP